MIRLIVVILILSSSAAFADQERNEALRVIQLQHQVWSNGNIELIPQIYAENFIGHFPERTVHGHSGIRDTILGHRQAFPDWTEVLIQLVYESNKAVSQFESQGTNLGTFLGNPATNCAVKITEAAVYHMEDGLIAEQWVYPDMAAMQRQLSATGEQCAPETPR